nr:hypothetical protein [uncultured Oscillibacter sp.]
MMNVKSEIQHILVTRTLEDMAQAGFLTAEELTTAKRLAVEKYRPSAVWE